MASLLRVDGLKTYFHTQRGVVKAVDGVSFSIGRGDAVGLAGESGCGKTTTAYAIMGLIPEPGRIEEGHIYLDGEDLVSKKEEEMRAIRWKRVSIIFQGAMNALNPVLKIGDQIVEAIKIHNSEVSNQEAESIVKKLFVDVGLEQERITNYPHEFSGGMRQRAMIAMALANNPDLVIADEPTTALDVTIQAQMLDLLKRLERELNMSLLFITHDLSVLAETCDRIAIMYAGRIMEYSDVTHIFADPIHPYTKGLIQAIPSMERGKTKTLFSIPGDPPDLIDPPTGCAFHPRCPYAQDICKEETPGDELPDRWYVACHFADELADVPPEEFWKDSGL